MGKNKTTEELQLNSALLAFHHVKGTHDGEQLARIALNITNQVGVTENVWIPLLFALPPANNPFRWPIGQWTAPRQIPWWCRWWKHISTPARLTMMLRIIISSVSSTTLPILPDAWLQRGQPLSSQTILMTLLIPLIRRMESTMSLPLCVILCVPIVLQASILTTSTIWSSSETKEDGLVMCVRATPKPASSMAHSTVTRALALWIHT